MNNGDNYITREDILEYSEQVRIELLSALILCRELTRWTIETEYPHGYADALERIDAVIAKYPSPTGH